MRRAIPVRPSWLGRRDVSEYTVLILISLLVGLAVGATVTLFRSAIGAATRAFFVGLRSPLSFLGDSYVVLPPVLGAGMAFLLWVSFPRLAVEGGIAEVIRSIVRRGGRISGRSTLFHFLAPVVSLGSGAPLGFEDPAARLGAGVASFLTQLFRFSERKVRIFAAAGAAAAIAAVFHAPIGGVFFAAEIVFVNELQSAPLSAVILASVASCAAAQAIPGQSRPFEIPPFSIGPASAYLAYLVFGLLSGLWSAAFVRFYDKAGRWIPGGKSRLPALGLLVGLSLLLGLAGRFFPGLFGVGYEAINLTLTAQIATGTALVLLLGKFLFAPAFLHAGAFGGVFAPSLFQGALLGYLFATTANRLLPLRLDPVAYSLVGMGSVLGGVNSIPLASALIILEMTGKFDFILPLLAGIGVSHLVARGLGGTAPHLLQLRKRGLDVQLGHEATLLHSLHVHDIFRPETNTVPARAKLSEILEHVLDSPYSSVFVVDDSHHIVGRIRERDLRQALVHYEALQSVVTAADLATRVGPVVRMDDDLHFVLQQFTHADQDELPVVSDIDPRRVIGLVTRRDILEAYNRALARHEMAEDLLDHLRLAERQEHSDVTPGYVLQEISAPPSLWGKSLREANLRARIGIEVILIRRGNSQGEVDRAVPAADTVIQEGDRLVVLGRRQDIERLCDQDLP
ncbi:MAG: chloride channel protein [candidate division KSB1 bacterium]|nr:chloride channel protein [candidate division KSB1 bacterium]